MRYGLMQRAMWAAFQKSFKAAIHTVLDENDADGVIRRAKKKYREILNSVDEFDKGSRFLTNILSCAMLSAVLLCTEKRYDVETVRIYYKTAMDNKIMRTNGFGRADNFIIGGIQFSITDIFSDRCCK